MVTSSLLLAMSGSSAAGLGSAQSSSAVLQGRLGCLRSDERSGAWGNNHGQLIKRSVLPAGTEVPLWLVGDVVL